MAKNIYFAFHYQDVIDFRANVVRNHGVIKGLRSAGYFDYSIWEESRKQGDLALKRMINAELEYTSVTVVLIGSSTFARRWVRYEIMKSLERGNGLLGIHINSIVGKDQRIKPLGPNPFDHLGLKISSNGKRADPIEWTGLKWGSYIDLASFEIGEQPIGARSKSFKLSHWFPAYDWTRDDGFKNFGRWIE